MGGRAAAVMIGRTVERKLIGDVLAAGAAGEPRAVIVRGEAGIGKTRLVAEALKAGPPPGSPPRVVAVGQCVDLGTIGAPFTSIRRLLRDLHAGVGDEVFRAAAGGPVVIATLSRLMPQLAGGAVAAPLASGDDYISEAIERVIEVLSADRHLVLLIEDLHWADAASVALLRTLAATLRGTHVSIIMTVRSDEVGRRHPLREVLVEMERHRSVAMIDVTRLSADEAVEQARAIVGSSLDAQHIATLAGRSDGVPFFVEELVQVASEDVPSTLREITMVRVERLSEPARVVVRLLAVGGLEVPATVLEGVWQGSSDELDRAIREAVDTDVLVPRGERYTFRHALIREAVYDDLMPTEAAAMHRRYAEQLQTRLDAGDVELASLASEHWLATHDSAKAFDATLLAREYAARTLASESAAELGERLLTLWPGIPDAHSRLGMSRRELRVAIATEYRAAHRMRACLSVLDDGLREADPDDAATRVPLELLLLTVSIDTERSVDDGKHQAEIKRLLENYDGPDAAVLRARAASAACDVAPEADRPQLAERAVALAEATGDRESLLEALRKRSHAALDLGQFDNALADFETARALVDPTTNHHMWISNNTVCAYIGLGKYDEAIAYGQIQVDASIAVGRERASGPTLSNIAEALISAGRLDEGLVAVRRARALVRTDSLRFNLSCLQVECAGLIWSDALDDARGILDQEAEYHELIRGSRATWLAWGTVMLDHAVAVAHQALPGHAGAALEEARVWLAHLSIDHEVRCELEGSLVSACAWLAAMRAAGGALPEDILAGARMVASTMPNEPWLTALAAIALAYLAMVDGVDAVAAWRDAEAKASLGRCIKRYLWTARFELGKALVAAGQRDEGVQLLTSVALEAGADGLMLLSRWARAELATRTTHARASAGPLGGLTPRELEVLALVAEGHTNSAIGAKLFISSKTASVHVSAILAKLGASNRAEAASLFAAVGPARSS